MASKRHSCAPSYLNLINFIPGTDSISNKPSIERTSTSKQDFVSEGIGHEVRSFYENLLNETNSSSTFNPSEKVKTALDSDDKESLIRKSKKRTISKRDSGCVNSYKSKNSPRACIPTTQTTFTSNQSNLKQRQSLKLLQYAQLGDVKNLRDLLNDRIKDLDVNFTDFYGWTPLMCAAKEGHVDVVELLLKCGANRHLCNSSNDTAETIARNAGHLSVVSILESYSYNKNVKKLKTEQQSNDQKTSTTLFHCDVCNRDFSKKEEASHYTSTVHLFNSGKRSNTPSYFIPNCNRGYQMLLRSGWDAQSGLGPEGRGRKYPVKTVLKQDRVGLGGEDVKRKKAKVTHFERGDTEAVNSRQEKNPKRQISVRKAARNAAKSKDRRARRWEQNLRFEMS